MIGNDASLRRFVKCLDSSGLIFGGVFFLIFRGRGVLSSVEFYALNIHIFRGGIFLGGEFSDMPGAGRNLPLGTYPGREFSRRDLFHNPKKI